MVRLKSLYRAKVKPPRIAKLAFPGVYWNIKNAENRIFLTFDDGPIPEITPWVIDTLKLYSVKATFFCVGDNVRKYPDVYKQIVDAGHAVGCHTYNHLNAWKTKKSDYLDNITLCEQYISTNLFRPPYGKFRNSIKRSISDRYKVIMWDVLTKDYDATVSPHECFSNVVDYTKGGSIIVFHDSIKSKENLYYALPRAIEYLQEKGFVFDAIRF